MVDAFSLNGKRIWVTGHMGLVGASIVRRLSGEDCQVLTVSHASLDLCDQAHVKKWMQENRPDVVIHAAARVGGIMANSARPADFLYDNLAMAQNVIHQSHVQKVQKLIFLGSSCIYPKYAPQPISEDALLDGQLEPTNEAYAVAKIAGLKLCQAYRKQYGDDFISLMPCNLYGPGDRWDEAQGHVIPGLISRIHEAKVQGLPTVSIWGSGKPLREFLYSDDLADAVFIALSQYSEVMPLNVGSGDEVAIADLAALICHIVGYNGELVFDSSKPDGTPRKVLNSDRMKALGWRPRMALTQGLEQAYTDFINRSEDVLRYEARGTG